MDHDLRQGRPGHHYCARCGQEFKDAGPGEYPEGKPHPCPEAMPDQTDEKLAREFLAGLLHPGDGSFLKSDAESLAALLQRVREEERKIGEATCMELLRWNVGPSR